MTLPGPYIYNAYMVKSVVPCPSGLMDKVIDSGSIDAGSIPVWDASLLKGAKFKVWRLFAIQSDRFMVIYYILYFGADNLNLLILQYSDII